MHYDIINMSVNLCDPIITLYILRGCYVFFFKKNAIDVNRVNYPFIFS